MNAILLTALLLLQQVGTVTHFFAFDYLDANITAAAVVRFEMQIDSGAWTSVGIPTNTLPITGGKTYKVSIPALTLGTHTVGFRACNVDLCGVGNPPSVSFKFTIMPGDVVGTRIIGGESESVPESR